ncbi:histone deacetylase [Billgrantia tianxiuensis]|nr:histone deacetylase [Halomonas tianxiuensis]
MAEPNSVIAFYDERVLSHQPDTDAPFLPNRMERRIRQLLASLNVPWKYPEHAGRLGAILNLLELEPVPGLCFESGKPATREQLGRVHTSSYLSHIFDLRGKNAWLDVDTTAVSAGSVDAAEVAAGTTIAAVEAVMQGRSKSAFALVRPPGHHAEPVRARGFCLFNNVAVAAAHARAELGCERVLIVDWDAHHANGTQDIFWADPNVMLFDIHRASPFYPGTGNLEDVGVGLGEGTTVNVPMPAGAGDQAYLKAFEDILVPAANWFQPDLILVSAGFDPHPFDLALNVSYEGFAVMTSMLQTLAHQHCGGRLVFVLEGGYHLLSLSRGVRTVLAVLAGEAAPSPGLIGVAEAKAAAAFHRQAFISEDPDSPT